MSERHCQCITSFKETWMSPITTCSPASHPHNQCDTKSGTVAGDWTRTWIYQATNSTDNQSNSVVLHCTGPQYGTGQARIQDFLTGGLTAGGVPPFSFPFHPFPSPSLLPLSPLPFPLPPSLPSLRSRPP